MTDADAPLSLEALLLLREGWDFEANTDGGVVVLGANERADGSVDTANSQQRRRNSEQSGPSSEQSSGVSSESKVGSVSHFAAGTIRAANCPTTLVRRTALV